MTRARVAAALAAILTVLLLQATVVGPWAMPVPVSLPAVLVAAVALVDGPGTGMAFGFTTGLIADLGSAHPAGVLALCWLAVGLAAGLAAGRNTIRHDAATAAVMCGLAALLAGVLLTVVHSGGNTVGTAVTTMLPAVLGDALLALAVVPIARRFLRTDALRAPHPEIQLDLAGVRG